LIRQALSQTRNLKRWYTQAGTIPTSMIRCKQDKNGFYPFEQKQTKRTKKMEIKQTNWLPERDLAEYKELDFNELFIVLRPNRLSKQHLKS
jgi:hypothetical protein